MGNILGRKRKNRGQVWRISGSGIWLEGKVGQKVKRQKSRKKERGFRSRCREVYLQHFKQSKGRD